MLRSNRVDLNTFHSSGHNCPNYRSFTARLPLELVVTSLQRALPWDIKCGILDYFQRPIKSNPNPSLGNSIPLFFPY